MHVFARSLRHGGYAGELDILKFITDIYREVTDPYQPKEGCQSNRFIRSCLFREFPVADKKK